MNSFCVTFGNPIQIILDLNMDKQQLLKHFGINPDACEVRVARNNNSVREVDHEQVEVRTVPMVPSLGRSFVQAVSCDLHKAISIKEPTPPRLVGGNITVMVNEDEQKKGLD